MKRETIIKATAVFQLYMPCQQLPEIHQVTVREFERKRSDLVERLQSSQDMYDAETDDSLMEFIHGEKGDAIIIKKDYFSNADEEGFANALWHELGHFVVTKAESPELRKFLEENNEELDIAYGYWFWSEFIAEAISCHVSNEYRKTMPNYHPEKAFCNLDSKLEVSNQISMMLNTIFRGPQIDILHKSARVCHLHGLFPPFRRRFSATLSGLLATQTIFLNNERGTSKNAVTTFKEVHRNDGLQENSYASKYGVQPTRNGTQ